MGTRTGNPTWQDSPSTATLITAARLNAVEREIDESAAVADAVPLSSSVPLGPTPSGFAGTAATAARGDHRHPVYVPGYPIPTDRGGLGAGPRALPLGRMGNTIGDQKAPLTPFPVYRKFTLNTLFISVGTAADAGTFSLVIYGSDIEGLPSGTRLWQSADTVATSTGIKTFSSINYLLDPGNYWLSFGAKGYSTTRPLPKGLDGSGAYVAWTLTGEYAFAQGGESGLYVNDYNETTGAWPTTAPLAVNTPSATSAFWYALNGTPST